MKGRKAFNEELFKTSTQKDSKSSLEDVIQISPNICEEKRVCPHCERGERFGIGLHFILHYEDGSLNTVCYGCGKKAAGITGLKLPPTEVDVFAREEERDLRLIRIARQKMEAKYGNI